MVGVDPLSHAPVLRGDAFQEVIVHVEADAQREERKLLPHHPLDVLLDGAEFDLTCKNHAKQRVNARGFRLAGQSESFSIAAESVLPTVGSPSDTRMIMETERGSMSP